MKEKAQLIKDISFCLMNNDKKTVLDIINVYYKFSNIDIKIRKRSEYEKLEIYLNDGFIDRYTGEKLIFPGMLKIISNYFPEEFPYHSHWKMEKTHIAYWELIPTIDHVVPIALGGEDEKENLITTSMMNNSIKSNWTLDKLGWKLQKRGNLQEWDGLCKEFVKIVEKNKNLMNDSYIAKWYRLLIKIKKESRDINFSL